MNRNLRNVRDERGWRVPRAGTLSFEIYRLTQAGICPKDIAELLHCSRSSVGVLLFRIRHPDAANSNGLAGYYETRARKSEMESDVHPE